MRLVVDVANVVGSRPDGWWRDRAGASSRMLEALRAVVGAEVELDGERVVVQEVVAVLEGQARAASDVRGVDVRRAAGSGDDALVVVAGEAPCVVVTADRGLRERLPPGTTSVGPRWLRGVLES